MKKFGKFLAVAALLTATATAHAVTVSITFGGNPALPGDTQTSSVAGATTINFNAPAGAACSSIASFNISGNAGITTGSSGTAAAPPTSNTSCYLTVPLTGGNGSAVWDSPGANNYLGLFWGSIDDYNSLEFLDAASNVIGTVTGTNVIDAGATFGDRISAGSNRYVNLFLSGGSYSAVRLVSTSFAFEVDNVAYARVPEPGTLALLGLGLVGLGVSRRRKQLMRPGC